MSTTTKMYIIDQKTLHEKYHSRTRSHKSIITKDNFTYRKLLYFIDKYIGADKHVLDVGCGSGTISLYLTSKGNKVLGIDISEKAVKECIASAKQLELQHILNFQVMEFPNKIPRVKFDAIICTEVIEHLLDDEQAMRALFHLLKKGGFVILSTPSKNAPLYRLGFATDFDKRVGHLRRYTMQELKGKSAKAGFKVVEECKTEGILRNFLYLNSYAGFFLRFIRLWIGNAVTFVDDISCKLFGESDLIVVLKK